MKATAGSMRVSRQQRRSMSLPEVLLWRHLRRSPGGLHFRRQHAVGPYVADFYCAAAKLVIEVDGQAHDMGKRPRRDETRASWLESQGLDVLRIPAKDVLKDPTEIADAIIAYCAGRKEAVHRTGPSTTQLR